MAPGLLYVTMQPGESLSADEFHDWYNNEHGPTRLRLPFIKNGLRYRATDLDGAGKGLPEWLALYDVTDMEEMNGEPYLRLRRDNVKSQREKETMGQIAIDRRLYDFVESRKVDGYVPPENELLDSDSPQRVLVAIIQTLHPGTEEGFNKWYREEHMSMLSKVPGWLSTQRFVTSSVDPKAVTEYLSLHEYAPQNGLDGPDMKAATSTPWRKQIIADTVKDRTRRVYNHFYTFGAAPRDLTSPKNAAAFSAPDGRTRVLPASSPSALSVPAIESFGTTPDGVDIPYRLEGSSDPDAPLIVLSNSILTHYSIWDGFLAEFFAKPANRKKYRVLRYLTRGRLSNCGEKHVTVDVLAEDIITLLDTLRVRRAAALIGVSLGGATVLNAALKYPNRVAAFVSCDTNSKSPEGNHKVWGERIAMSEKEGAVGRSGEPIVGGELADITVRRWLVKESYDGGEMEALARQVTDMVRNNSLVGFKKSVEALFSYDLRDEMKASGARGAFVVGSSDGVLPKTMKEMTTQMGPTATAEYYVVDGAGHLPMVEKPKEFDQFIEKFLDGQ